MTIGFNRFEDEYHTEIKETKSGFKATRQMKFEESEERELIHIKMFSMTPEGTKYLIVEDPLLPKLFDLLCSFGGLITFTLILAWFIYGIVEKPFRNLNLAINYYKLKKSADLESSANDCYA